MEEVGDDDPAALQRTRPPVARRTTTAPLPDPTPPAVPAPVRAPMAPAFVFATPAPLWRRPLAWLVDLVLLGAAATGPIVGTLVLRGHELRSLEPGVIAAFAPFALGFCALIALLYAIAFAVLWRGQTPGRRLLGLHLVDRMARPPGVLRAFMRALLALASFGLFLGGFWFALFDRRGQTWHDKLTGTFVVRLRPSTP